METTKKEILERVITQLTRFSNEKWGERKRLSYNELWRKAWIGRDVDDLKRWIDKEEFLSTEKNFMNPEQKGALKRIIAEIKEYRKAECLMKDCIVNRIIGGNDVELVEELLKMEK